jgi:hypothetical protein
MPPCEVGLHRLQYFLATKECKYQHVHISYLCWLVHLLEECGWGQPNQLVHPYHPPTIKGFLQDFHCEPLSEGDLVILLRLIVINRAVLLNVL